MEKFTNCSAEFMTIHEVYETTDERGTEGANLGSYFSETQANTIAKNKGYYGSNGSIKKTNIVLITTQAGDKKAFTLSSESEIDISKVTTDDQYSKISNALDKVKGMNLSQDELSILASQLK